MTTLVSNPGSNSRKYSIFSEKEEILRFLFDPDTSSPKCYVTDKSGEERVLFDLFKSLPDSSKALKTILDNDYPSLKIDMILIRIVATGDYFVNDHLVDDECIEMLKRDGARTPLHAPITLAEVNALKKAFPETKIALISDSSFHKNRPLVSKYYGINMELSDRAQIKRYGAHGLSMESIVHQLELTGNLTEKVVVCHVGSGVSVTAIKNGESFETTMGYTPLEGVMMATRCGDIDPAAVFALKRTLELSDEDVEKYLNQNCGLLGISGFNDFREVYSRRMTDVFSSFAYKKFVYRIQQEVGKMAASMGGVDTLVLTATICEREAGIRTDIVKNLGFLGFQVDEAKNKAHHYSGMSNIGTTHSKPVFVIGTNETKEMLNHAESLLS